MSDRDRTDAEIAALASLHESEISANIGELQATTTIVLGLLAYLASTVFLFDNLQTRLLTLLPLGVIFGCSYQMLRAAVVVRRAAVAREYERQLAKAVGFERKLQEAKIGSTFYGSLDDIGVIWATPGLGKWPKLFIAAVAYFGLYALSLAYTTLVMTEVLGRDDAGRGSVVMCIVYGALWALVLGAAAVFFQPRKVSKLD